MQLVVTIVRLLKIVLISSFIVLDIKFRNESKGSHS